MACGKIRGCGWRALGTHGILFSSPRNQRLSGFADMGVANPSPRTAFLYAGKGWLAPGSSAE